MDILKTAPQSSWPEPGDSLFAGASDWETLAAIGGNDWHGLLLYAQSYKEAADVVVDHIEHTRRRQDSMVYAVMLLYRHYIELTLKGLLRLGSMFEGSAPEYPKHHSIYGLWHLCKPMLKTAFPTGDDSATKAVEECMKQIALMDPSGEAWRFPEDKKGRAIRHSVCFLSLRNTRKVMDKIAGYLEGSYDGMDELLEFDGDSDSYDEPE